MLDSSVVQLNYSYTFSESVPTMAFELQCDIVIGLVRFHAEVEILPRLTNLKLQIFEFQGNPTTKVDDNIKWFVLNDLVFTISYVKR